MTRCEQYLQYQDKWSKYACDGDWKKSDEYSQLGLELRDSFIKSDWEELIAQSHGRAKYEYTRMMKEKFPD